MWIWQVLWSQTSPGHLFNIFSHVNTGDVSDYNRTAWSQRFLKSTFLCPPEISGYPVSKQYNSQSLIPSARHPSSRQPYWGNPTPFLKRSTSAIRSPLLPIVNPSLVLYLGASIFGWKNTFCTGLEKHNSWLELIPSYRSDEKFFSGQQLLKSYK